MLERGPNFLPRDDPESTKFLRAQMESDGVNLMYNTSPVSFKNVEGSDGALIEVQMTQKINGVPTPTTKQYDTVLFATGR